MDNVGTLVISPTHELASQIAVEAQKLTSHHAGFDVSLFVGGVDKRGQLNGFNRGRKDILVATPGRLKDFLSDSRSGVAEALKNTKMLILDEADPLLDMGFREDIEEIMRVLPSNATRQTFFSATVSKGIQQIAHTHLAPNHRFVNCVSEEGSPFTCCPLPESTIQANGPAFVVLETSPVVTQSLTTTPPLPMDMERQNQHTEALAR
ncbi:hypothetical protein D9611_005972 [Ephemerocybe angulata]|uniref:ATP-dependent RNA helicase n=1 Tax=Ephemerocybe angulata TaxID=980116 RepID=A0A8H5CG02_9AGAR|nr:hypothetical protein D9611_005972 [Tulosesus angulatus]